jgi:hypothetical protein
VPLGHVPLGLVLLRGRFVELLCHRGCKASAMLACCTFRRRLATREVLEDGLALLSGMIAGPLVLLSRCRDVRPDLLV